MADTSNLSVHCELADYIAGCTEDMMIDMRYDPATNTYTFCGSKNPDLAGRYEHEDEFFLKMHAVLRLHHRTPPKMSGHHTHPSPDVLRISPFVLEVIYRTREYTPQRVVFGALHQMSVTSLRKRIVNATINLKDGTGVPISYIVVDRLAMTAFLQRFFEATGRRADNLTFDADKGPGYTSGDYIA